MKCCVVESIFKPSVNKHSFTLCHILAFQPCWCEPIFAQQGLTDLILGLRKSSYST